jgi:hypothetical protein
MALHIGIVGMKTWVINFGLLLRWHLICLVTLEGVCISFTKGILSRIVWFIAFKLLHMIAGVGKSSVRDAPSRFDSKHGLNILESTCPDGYHLVI